MRLKSVFVLLFAALCGCMPERLPSDDGGTVDSGVPDGGLDGGVLLDGGAQSDGGAPSDGGEQVDGGLSCDLKPHDSVLGTARLGAGFRVVDSKVLPVTYHLPLGVNDEVLDGGPGLAVYGYMATGRVHRLGGWPSLEVPDDTNVAFDAVKPVDRSLQVLTTWALPSTHGQLLAGYRTVQAQAFVGGAVARFDTQHPDGGVQWFDAPGIESALGLGSYFLVGANGLGSVTGTRGVYAIDTAQANPTPSLAAAYPINLSDTVRPGLMAVTTQGLVVLGYYLDLANRHSLRLPPPAPLAVALSGGAPVALGDAPELSAANDIVNIAGFGAGVAVLHTSSFSGILPALGQLQYYPLTPQGGQAVVGTPTSVLSADDACTVVSQLVSARTELLVGLWDRNGQRIVRLAPR